jgi:hypothetical protein
MQELSLDTTPMTASLVGFAEHLQVEAEQLMLSTPASASTLASAPPSTTTTDAKQKELAKTAALKTMRV